MSQFTATATQYLIRNEKTGTYFIRKWVSGRAVRISLKTKQLSVAKAKLPQELAKLPSSKAGDASFNEATNLGQCIENVKRRTEINPNLREASRKYRLNTIIFLEKTFPKIKTMKPKELTPIKCEEWFTSLKGKYSGALVNNALGSLRMIVDEAVKSGLILRDPTTGIKRARVKAKNMSLPSTADFKRLVAAIRKPKDEKKHSYRSDAAADLVEFLAYSGCRIAEANGLKWSDVRREAKNPTIYVTGKGGYSRHIPIIAPMKDLLSRLPVKGDYVLRVKEAEQSLSRACGDIGIERITHHDLRHLFATTCIESGVDIPTVSRWLGHKDGGVLALRTYGHLRETHSASVADKVKF